MLQNCKNRYNQSEYKRISNRRWKLRSSRNKCSCPSRKYTSLTKRINNLTDQLEQIKLYNRQMAFFRDRLLEFCGYDVFKIENSRWCPEGVAHLTSSKAICKNIFCRTVVIYSIPIKYASDYSGFLGTTIRNSNYSFVEKVKNNPDIAKVWQNWLEFLDTPENVERFNRIKVKPKENMINNYK